MLYYSLVTDSIVHAVEMVPGGGSNYALTSGAKCEVLQHTLARDKTLIRYPSGGSQNTHTIPFR